MLDNDVRKLFKKWKLYERKWALCSIVCYESPLIRVERIFSPEEKEQMHAMLFNLYFDYEFDWTPISNRSIAKLLWVDHQTINNAMNKIKAKGREALEPTVIKFPSSVHKIRTI